MNRKSLNSIVWPIVIGLLLALVVVQFLQSQRLTQALQNAAASSVAVQKNSGSTVSARNAADSYAEAVARAMPSVVKIYTTRISQTPRHPLLNDPFFQRFFNSSTTPRQNKIERGLGSGVIVREDGYILTNNHVIENVDRIRIMLADGRERLARVIGTDEATDLAVLKIELEEISAASFAEPGTERIGDIVLAIGNPYGIGQTVTQGIISATGRHGLQLNTYENYIQTDAAINQGNSGGALVNTTGEVVGINSGLYSRSGGSTGIGFAIPAKTALHVLEHIIDHGEVVRGWLGVSVEDITPALAEAFQLGIDKGLIITNIAPGGPADASGLQVGDIMTHIENQPIVNGNESMHKVAQTAPGKKINVNVVRNGMALSVLVAVGKRPETNRSGSAHSR